MASLGKAKKEEEEFEEVLQDALVILRSDFHALSKAIDFNEENPRKLALLVNSRSRIIQQILYCVAMMRDPKLRLTSEGGRRRDFARIIEKALLKDNPLVSKLMDEASSKEESKEEGEKG